MQQVLHYFLHFVFPVMIAFWFYRENWIRTSAVFLLTMLVDLDHLLATPVYDSCRCSIGFHPLHSYVAMGIYTVLLLHPKIRIIAMGLLLHMMTDSIDCVFSNANCK